MEQTMHQKLELSYMRYEDVRVRTALYHETNLRNIDMQHHMEASLKREVAHGMMKIAQLANLDK